VKVEMATNAVPRVHLNNGENPAEQWTEWLSSFKIYLIASGVNKKSEKIQIAQLLHFAGWEIQKIHSTFTFTQEEENKLEEVIKKFNAHFTPRKNLTFERYKFFTMRQAEEMTTEQFITDLRRQSKVCSFGDLYDQLIKLMLICRTNNGEIRLRLLQEEEADLQKAIKTCNIIE
jgi:hypothetical protein